MGRPIDYARVGTRDSWERNKEKYPGSYHVVPASLYVSETGICLVTSQDWVDWLLGRTDEIPGTEEV